MDFQGRLNGTFHALVWTTVKLAIPVGTEPRVATATLALTNGAANPQQSKLDATLILPFGKGEAPITVTGLWGGGVFAATALGGQQSQGSTTTSGNSLTPMTPALQEFGSSAIPLVSQAHLPIYTKVNLNGLTIKNASSIQGNPSALSSYERNTLVSSLGFALGAAGVIATLPSLAPVDPLNRGSIHFEIPTWDGNGIASTADKTGSLVPILLEEIDPITSASGQAPEKRPVIELSASKLTVFLPAHEPRGGLSAI